MMGTERRPSLAENASSPSSSSHSPSAAVPRDFQEPQMPSKPTATAGSGAGPSPPLRKRRRSDVMPDISQGARPSLPPMALSANDRREVDSRTEQSKRQKSTSPPPASYDRGSDAASRSRPGPAPWNSWSDRPSAPARYGRPPFGEQEPAGQFRARPMEQESSWRDSRGVPALAGGRPRLDADRPPSDFEGHSRPQSEMPDTMRASHRTSFPVSAPSTSAPTEKLAPAMPRRHPASPPPRLPSFAALESEGMASRSRDDGPPGFLPGPGGFGGSGHPSPRRMLPYRPPGAFPPYLPGAQGRTPVMSHATPSSSSSYGNPPMIHPSLAGLPGAGSGQGGKQQPSFVSKLYSMLEDPSIEDMISWGPSGAVFSVANPAEFSRLVLPNWFKHSNWQSFVRQLNMYGFHKVNHSYQGNPTDEIQVWEFRHPNFRRGEVGLLNDIKRKSSRQKRTGSPSRSLAGTDLRADRSGGSSTPSPEVPLAAIPGGEMGRMHMGMHRQAMSDPRMDARAYELASSDPRGLRVDEGGYLPFGDPRYRRLKTEAPEGGPSTYSAAGAGFLEDRAYPDSQMDRNEIMARFEDVSERSDAIIRHASFLEGQVRTLSEQLSESRAYTQHCVREELSIVLERLARTLSSPAPSGADPTQAMLAVIQSHLAALQPRERETMPTDSRQSGRPAPATPRSPSQTGPPFLSKRSSV